MPAIPPLPLETILLVEVGSTAHGTGLPGGEGCRRRDRRGGPRPRRARPGDRHAAHTAGGGSLGPGGHRSHAPFVAPVVRLAASGNPSILMTFWALLMTTPAGDELQALGEAFVGRHVVPRYRGYMQSQAQRLLGLRGGGHGRRGGGGREGLIEAFGYDTKYAMHAARLGFQCQELLTSRRLNLPVQGEPAEWLRAVRRGDVPFNDWWDRCIALDAELERMAGDDSYPATADRDRIVAWSTATHLAAWS